MPLIGTLFAQQKSVQLRIRRYGYQLCCGQQTRDQRSFFYVRLSISVRFELWFAGVKDIVLDTLHSQLRDSIEKMNRPVQALDPSSGIWLRGKVCEENEETLVIKWKDYKQKSSVEKHKVRDVELRRKVTVDKNLWPNFSNPSKLQRGDLINLRGELEPEKFMVIEENDPFRAEVTTSCGRLLRYSSITEARIYSLSEDEIERAGLPLPTLQPPPTTVLSVSSRQQNVPVAGGNNDGGLQESNREKKTKQGKKTGKPRSGGTNDAHGANKENEPQKKRQATKNDTEGKTKGKRQKVMVQKKAAHQELIGGGGDIGCVTSDTFQYDKDILPGAESALRELLAELTNEGVKVKLASDFWTSGSPMPTAGLVRTNASTSSTYLGHPISGSVLPRQGAPTNTTAESESASHTSSAPNPASGAPMPPPGLVTTTVSSSATPLAHPSLSGSALPRRGTTTAESQSTSHTSSGTLMPTAGLVRTTPSTSAAPLGHPLLSRLSLPTQGAATNTTVESESTSHTSSAPNTASGPPLSTPELVTTTISTLATPLHHTSLSGSALPRQGATTNTTAKSKSTSHTSSAPIQTSESLMPTPGLVITTASTSATPLSNPSLSGSSLPRQNATTNTTVEFESTSHTSSVPKPASDSPVPAPGMVITTASTSATPPSHTSLSGSALPRQGATTNATAESKSTSHTSSVPVQALDSPIPTPGLVITTTSTPAAPLSHPSLSGSSLRRPGTTTNTTVESESISHTSSERNPASGSPMPAPGVVTTTTSTFVTPHLSLSGSASPRQGATTNTNAESESTSHTSSAPNPALGAPMPTPGLVMTTASASATPLGHPSLFGSAQPRPSATPNTTVESRSSGNTSSVSNTNLSVSLTFPTATSPLQSPGAAHQTASTPRPELDSAFLDLFDSSSCYCGAAGSIERLREDMRRQHEALLADVRQRHEAILSELLALKRAFGLVELACDVPLEENDVLDVVDVEGGGQYYKVKDEVLYTLYPFNSDPKVVARKLADRVFSKEERIDSNINGSRGKKKLDPARVSAMKSALLQVCPGNDREELWRNAIVAIDAASRYFRHKDKQDP